MTLTNEEYNMLLEGLKSEDPDVRRESTEDLGYSGMTEAAVILADYLDDPDRGVKDAVAEALKKIGTEQACDKVVEYLSSDKIDVRNYAVDVLSSLKSIAVNSLTKTLQSNDKDVRKFAVDILGIIGDKKAFEPLSNMIKDDDENVRVSVLEALGNIHDIRSERLLINFISKCDKSTFKATAIEALGKVGSEKGLDFITSLTEHEDPVVALTAIETIGKLGNRDSLKMLLTKINEVDDFLIPQVFIAILNICKRLDISIFDEILGDKCFVKIADQAYIDRSVSELLSEVVITKLKPEDIHKVECVAEYLTKDAKMEIMRLMEINNFTDSVKTIQKFLDDTDRWIVFKVCDLISKLKILEVEDKLIKLLELNDLMMKISGIRALGNIGSKKALPVLETLLDSDNEDIKGETSDAIEKIKKS